MRSVGTFFEKLKNAVNREMAVRQDILDAVAKNVGSGLQAKDIEVKNKIIRIRAGSALKNQIFIKKEPILKEIREKNPRNVFIDLQ